METKHNPIETCELKFNDDEWRVEGYASVFNSVDLVGDTVKHGAFAKSIEEGANFRMHMEHLRWIVPGKWESAVEDEKGLRVTGHLTRDHSVAKDLRASMRHGTVKGLSIGFYPTKFEASDQGGRVLHEIDLVEVSFTANPAEPKATIESFKSELMALKQISDFEAFLRESGNYSRSMATAFVSHLKSVLSESDSAEKEIKRERERQEAEVRKLLALHKKTFSILE